MNTTLLTVRFDYIAARFPHAGAFYIGATLLALYVLIRVVRYYRG